MNALDSLFDFAALMSTSSAMTFIPDPNDSNGSAQGTQTSKGCSASIAPAQSSQVPGRMRHRSQQLHSNMHSLPQIEVPIATLSRAHVDPKNQHSIDWISAPPFLQEMSVQGQHPFLPDHSRLPAYDVPAFDCYDVSCSHYPTLRYSCNCTFPLLRRYQQGPMVPNTEDDQRVLLEQYGPEPQHFQQLPANVFSGEAYVLGQQLPPHSCRIENSCESVARHSVALQHDILGMGMEAGCHGRW
jgi:hypothetical protein